MVYAAVGTACAIAILRASPKRDASAVGSALLGLLIWPLWAPVVLTQRAPPVGATPPTANTPKDAVFGARDRIQVAIREGVEACAGTPLETLFSGEAGLRIAAEVERAVARHAEIRALIGRTGFDVNAVQARLRELESTGGSARSIATARLQLENVRRLVALRERDARTLGEIEDLMQALKTQLVLMRFEGSGAEGASGLVAELWARVEGLGGALGAEEAAEGEGGS